MAMHFNLDGNLNTLVHYLRPALDDLRQRDLGFESYLLEMVILSLQEKPAGQQADIGRAAN